SVFEPRLFRDSMGVTGEERSAKVVGNRAEEYPEREQGFEKERETKDDGRYIIFYAFDDEPPAGGHSDGGGGD
ncbi:MAG TPA: hypothetical protein VE225_03365, partial [Rubrobacteraceae bacterium]|nr:hypothetical protein [Rubrobacteraceae bacterium]